MGAVMHHVRQSRELKPGVYGPLPTFFDNEQELDLASYEKHLLSEWMSERSTKRREG